ncbi:hypothetical protein, partial [Streptomyces calidiresistens]
MGTVATLALPPGPSISPPSVAATTLRRRPHRVPGPAVRVADTLYVAGELRQVLGVRPGRTDTRIFLDAFTLALAPGANLLVYRPELHPPAQHRDRPVPGMQP